MGEQQLDQVTSDELVYVPASEFRRLLDARLSPHLAAEAFAAVARINTLYMIARAWSGHIGTSFSSLEIMSWLFLNEMRDLDRGPGACDMALIWHGAGAASRAPPSPGRMPPR